MAVVTNTRVTNPARKAAQGSEWDWAIKAGAYSFIAALSILILLIMLTNYFPDTFGNMFDGILYHREAGVYADCSLRENYNSSICERRRQESKRDRDWNEMRRGTNYQFDLNK